MNTGLPGFSFPTLSAGDYDNDSHLDILAGTLTTQLRVWRNTGTTFSNTFVNEVSMNGCPCSFPVWGDHDNNGRIDILTHHMDPETYDITTVLWQNTPTGMVIFDLHIGPHTAPAAAWGDYDNDGWLDVLFHSLYARSVLWRNTQTGFTDVASDLPSSVESSISWGDYDNDGRLDLALTGWLETGGRTCDVWRNTGRGFSNIMAHLPPVGGAPGSSYWVSIPVRRSGAIMTTTANWTCFCMASLVISATQWTRSTYVRYGGTLEPASPTSMPLSQTLWREQRPGPIMTATVAWTLC
jgi:hypothetical protein